MKRDAIQLLSNTYANKSQKQMKLNHSSSNDLFSLLDDASTNKVGKLNNNNNNHSDNVPGSGYSNNNSHNNNINGPINMSSTDNSYIDFVKSLGWENNSGMSNFNNVPHLDIYFLNDKGEEKQQNNRGNFLEMDTTTKFFTPDMTYVNKVNDPKNGFLWKAKVYDDFVGKSYSQMRNLLGNINYLKQIPDLAEESESSSSFLEFSIKVSVIHL